MLLNVNPDSVDLEWGVSFCLSDKFPGGATAAAGSKDLRQPSYLTDEENEALRDLPKMTAYSWQSQECTFPV